MQPARILAKTTASLAALVFAIVIAATASFAASGFVGKWKVEDTTGKSFTIWLSDDGKAKGDRAGEGLMGMWKEDGDSAVITWDTEWTTKITKEGDKYTKTALKNGKEEGKSSEAVKEE
jgi:hypothetical protein